MTLPGAPDWPRDAAARAWEEARLFARTAAGFSVRPGKFTQAWADGEIVALNPLGMLATAAGLVGGANNLLARLVGHDGGSSSLLEDLLAACAPFAHYALLGALCHLLLLLTRSRRRLRDSVAVALFAGAGPSAIATVLGVAIGGALWLGAGSPQFVRGGLFATLHGPAHTVLLLVAVSGFAAFLVPLALSLSALHQRPLALTALALGATLIAVGIAFGLLPPLPFGTRLVIWLHPFQWALWID